MTAPTKHSRTARLRKFWPLLPLAAILIALMLSDLDVMGYSPFDSNACSTEEVAQSGFSARFYAPLAQRALRNVANTPTSVAIVTIDAKTEPPGLLNNTCASRDFLARLVGDLNTLGARVIMIDKYYAPDSCADTAKTAHFIAALESSAAHVIVGQPTHTLTAASGGCLALSPRLEFDPTPAGPNHACKVCFGLNRLNADTLKIPLRWPLFREPQPLAPSAIQPAMSIDSVSAAPATPVTDLSQGDGLALVAATTYNPQIASAPKLVKMLNSGHPYTTFLTLPSVNAMTALCNAEPAHKYTPGAAPGDPDLCTPWLLKPADFAAVQNAVNGKVVVIGDLSEQDLHPFPGGDQPGVYLQANYVQSILDQRFLEEIPLWLTITLLVLFVVGVYCLYWAHNVHGEPRLTAEQAGIASVCVLVLLVVVSLGALLKFQYYTPIWALWGAGVFMLFRYLEASGHHRSEHLMAQLAGEAHRVAEEMHPSHRKHIPQDKP